MLMASIAIAEHLNLFSFFGERDERYATVAPEATLTITEPALIANEHLGDVHAAIDSAYFDGLTLNLAYRIENSRLVEEYTPTAEEIAAMQPDEPVILAVMDGEPGNEIYMAYNEAIRKGTPFGYRQYNVYPSDHTTVDDGMDIPPYSSLEEYDESGAYCEMREFETPLPEALRDLEELTVSIRLYQQETIVWFDGTNCYLRYDRGEVGTMTATIPRMKDALRTLSGTGSIHGVRCEATAQVSQMAATITLRSDAPFNQFLATPPQGIDPLDSWVEISVFDENGRALRAQEGFCVDDRTTQTLSFLATGTLPKTLTLYMYTAWEGGDAPDISTLEGIVMTMQ